MAGVLSNQSGSRWLPGEQCGSGSGTCLRVSWAGSPSLGCSPLAGIPGCNLLRVISFSKILFTFY